MEFVIKSLRRGTEGKVALLLGMEGGGGGGVEELVIR